MLADRPDLFDLAFTSDLQGLADIIFRRASRLRHVAQFYPGRIGNRSRRREQMKQRCRITARPGALTQKAKERLHSQAPPSNTEKSHGCVEMGMTKPALPTSHRTPHGRIRLLAIGLIALASCTESDQDASGQAPAAAPRATLTRSDWLEASDMTPPELWLASLSAGTGTSFEAAEAEHLRDLIAQARTLFHETPRMLANRTAQLHRMLAGRAIEETPSAILEGLIIVAGNGRKRSYGALCQHYFNLRAEGHGRTEALGYLLSHPTDGL